MVKKTPGSENIRVVVRCRDLLAYEAERGDKPLVRLDLATNQIIVNHLIGDPDVFAFDAVYNNTFTQRDIFLQEVRPLADAVLQGYNATVFAYGQSGSGKTHTMTGKLSQRESWGMMPQLVDYLFAEIRKLSSQTRSFKVRVSYVELYNGKSRDLLASKQVNLEIKQNMAKNFYVKGAEMPEVTSFDEAVRWFNAGTERRQTASTDLNDTSSRSHSLFTVQIEQLDFENDPSSPIVMTSKVNVVDLAGSEKLSKTNATGDTAKEGCNINLSLSALATVIDTIVKGGKHIPYRGSPLTMLLKDSLGGNSKTVMFANVGPSDKNTSETISTLRFALRAKQIENKPLKNVDPKDARIQDLLDQVEQLKARLGNVDLNVEDDLRRRIEELEVENSDLRGGGEKGALELEERCRGLQVAIEAHERTAADAQRELQREAERRALIEVNYASEQQRGRELRSLVSDFVKRVCSDEQLASIRAQMPADGSYNRGDADWGDKEIAFYLQGFAELYAQWRRSAYTQADMERYAQRVVAEVQQQAQQQLTDAARARDELQRQRDDEAARRVAEMEATSQLKVDLTALRDENEKLRAKVLRDQEKIKAKLRKHADEARALQDQVEAGRTALLEKERDVERLRRMLEEGNLQASRLLNASLSGAALAATTLAAVDGGNASMTAGDAAAAAAAVAAGAAGGSTTTLLRQLEEERRARRALEGKVREANVSLRRYGVCIVDGGNPAVAGDGKAGADGDAVSAAAGQDAFMLAAAEEKEVDGDALAHLQQQLRIKQRLSELAQQQQRRLDDMLRKYELLKTGTVTSLGALASASTTTPLTAPLLASGGAGAAMLDEATAVQIKELLQSKDDELERLRREKDETCDKLVRRLNKGERKQKELESALEEERAQAAEERVEAGKEADALRAHNQQLAVELETLRGQLDAAREQVEREQRTRESEVEYVKSQVDALQAQLSATRSRMAELDEMRKSYERLQQQTARSELALAERTEALEKSRQMVKWSNALLEQEKRKTEDLEATLRQRELEQRRREEAWKVELAEQMNLQAATNNRRLEAQAAQFQEQLAEEQTRQRALHKKVKSAKNNAAKVAQRYDEMILENEALISKIEEMKVESMRMYLEKQEAQRDLDALRPTTMMRARNL